jgi:hypothetical protein
MVWLYTEIAAPKGATERYAATGSCWRTTAVFNCDECGKEGRRELRRRSRTTVTDATYCNRRCAAVSRARARYEPLAVVANRPSKTCSTCKKHLPRSAFQAVTDKRDGMAAHCRPCRRANLNHNARRRYGALRVAELCIQCGAAKTLNGAGACEGCAAERGRYHRELRRSRMESGVCYSCGKGEPFAADMCRRCWFRRVATNTLSDPDAGAQIETIWERQRGRCAVTGDLLVPGHRRVSLDHIHPKAARGTNEPGNLRWVTFAVNRAKSHMLDVEFVEMCRRVVATFDSR